jgi:DNA-binding beta-propeller fold protein YncE
MNATRPNARPTLLVTVRDSVSLCAFDVETGDSVGIAKTGEEGVAKPHEFAVTKDGRTAFTSIYGNRGYGTNDKPGKQLGIVDLETMTTTGMVDLDLYRAPHGMDTDRDGMIWVTAEVNRCALVVDPDARKIARSIWMEAPVHFLAQSRDGKRMYFSHKEIPFVSVVDIERKQVAGRIGLPIGSQAVFVSPDDRFLYVGDFNRPMLHVIDCATNALARTVPLKAVPGWPYATPDGKYVIVTTYDEPNDRGYIEILRAADLSPAGVVEAGAEPFHALAAGDGRHIYVALGDGRIPKIDLERAQIAEDRMKANGTGAEKLMIVPR